MVSLSYSLRANPPNGCVFFVVTVLVFTVICLALAANFQHVLASSDLSESTRWYLNHTHGLTEILLARFVPFSIFVCCAGMFIVSAL